MEKTQLTSSVEEYDGGTIVKRLSVPIGLEELMEGLTKEVLKKKPRDVYHFSSEYFTELLGIRDQGRHIDLLRSLSYETSSQKNPKLLRKTKSVSSDLPSAQIKRQFSFRETSPPRKGVLATKIPKVTSSTIFGIANLIGSKQNLKSSAEKRLKRQTVIKKLNGKLEFKNSEELIKQEKEDACGKEENFNELIKGKRFVKNKSQIPVPRTEQKNLDKENNGQVKEDLRESEKRRTSDPLKLEPSGISVDSKASINEKQDGVETLSEVESLSSESNSDKFIEPNVLDISHSSKEVEGSRNNDNIESEPNSEESKSEQSKSDVNATSLAIAHESIKTTVASISHDMKTSDGLEGKNQTEKSSPEEPQVEDKNLDKTLVTSEGSNLEDDTNVDFKAVKEDQGSETQGGVEPDKPADQTPTVSSSETKEKSLVNKELVAKSQVGNEVAPSVEISAESEKLCEIPTPTALDVEVQKKTDEKSSMKELEDKSKTSSLLQNKAKETDRTGKKDSQPSSLDCMKSPANTNNQSSLEKTDSINYNQINDFLNAEKSFHDQVVDTCPIAEVKQSDVSLDKIQNSETNNVIEIVKVKGSEDGNEVDAKGVKKDNEDKQLEEDNENVNKNSTDSMNVEVAKNGNTTKSKGVESLNNKGKDKKQDKIESKVEDKTKHKEEDIKEDKSNNINAAMKHKGENKREEDKKDEIDNKKDTKDDKRENKVEDKAQDKKENKDGKAGKQEEKEDYKKHQDQISGNDVKLEKNPKKSEATTSLSNDGLRDSKVESTTGSNEGSEKETGNVIGKTNASQEAVEKEDRPKDKEHKEADEVDRKVESSTEKLVTIDQHSTAISKAEETTDGNLMKNRLDEKMDRNLLPTASGENQKKKGGDKQTKGVNGTEKEKEVTATTIITDQEEVGVQNKTKDLTKMSGDSQLTRDLKKTASMELLNKEEDTENKATETGPEKEEKKELKSVETDLGEDEKAKKGSKLLVDQKTVAASGDKSDQKEIVKEESNIKLDDKKGVINEESMHNISIHKETKQTENEQQHQSAKVVEETSKSSEKVITKSGIDEATESKPTAEATEKQHTRNTLHITEPTDETDLMTAVPSDFSANVLNMNIKEEPRKDRENGKEAKEQKADTKKKRDISIVKGDTDEDPNDKTAVNSEINFKYEPQPILKQAAQDIKCVQDRQSTNGKKEKDVEVQKMTIVDEENKEGSNARGKVDANNDVNKVMNGNVPTPPNVEDNVKQKEKTQMKAPEDNDNVGAEETAVSTAPKDDQKAVDPAEIIGVEAAGLTGAKLSETASGNVNQDGKERESRVKEAEKAEIKYGVISKTDTTDKSDKKEIAGGRTPQKVVVSAKDSGGAKQDSKHKETGIKRIEEKKLDKEENEVVPISKTPSNKEDITSTQSEDKKIIERVEEKVVATAMTEVAKQDNKVVGVEVVEQRGQEESNDIKNKQGEDIKTAETVEKKDSIKVEDEGGINDEDKATKQDDDKQTKNDKAIEKTDKKLGDNRVAKKEVKEKTKSDTIEGDEPNNVDIHTKENVPPIEKSKQKERIDDQNHQGTENEIPKSEIASSNSGDLKETIDGPNEKTSNSCNKVNDDILKEAASLKVDKDGDQSKDTSQEMSESVKAGMRVDEKHEQKDSHVNDPKKIEEEKEQMQINGNKGGDEATSQITPSASMQKQTASAAVERDSKQKEYGEVGKRPETRNTKAKEALPPLPTGDDTRSNDVKVDKQLENKEVALSLAALEQEESKQDSKKDAKQEEKHDNKIDKAPAVADGYIEVNKVNDEDRSEKKEAEVGKDDVQGKQGKHKKDDGQEEGNSIGTGQVTILAKIQGTEDKEDAQKPLAAKDTKCKEEETGEDKAKCQETTERKKDDVADKENAGDDTILSSKTSKKDSHRSDDKDSSDNSVANKNANVENITSTGNLNKDTTSVKNPPSNLAPVAKKSTTEEADASIVTNSTMTKNEAHKVLENVERTATKSAVDSLNLSTSSKQPSTAYDHPSVTPVGKDVTDSKKPPPSGADQTIPITKTDSKTFVKESKPNSEQTQRMSTTKDSKQAKSLHKFLSVDVASSKSRAKNADNRPSTSADKANKGTKKILKHSKTEDLSSAVASLKDQKDKGHSKTVKMAVKTQSKIQNQRQSVEIKEKSKSEDSSRSGEKDQLQAPITEETYDDLKRTVKNICKAADIVVENLLEPSEMINAVKEIFKDPEPAKDETRDSKTAVETTIDADDTKDIASKTNPIQGTSVKTSTAEDDLKLTSAHVIDKVVSATITKKIVDVAQDAATLEHEITTYGQDASLNKKEIQIADVKKEEQTEAVKRKERETFNEPGAKEKEESEKGIRDKEQDEEVKRQDDINCSQNLDDDDMMQKDKKEMQQDAKSLDTNVQQDKSLQQKEDGSSSDKNKKQDTDLRKDNEEKEVQNLNKKEREAVDENREPDKGVKKKKEINLDKIEKHDADENEKKLNIKETKQGEEKRLDEKDVRREGQNDAESLAIKEKQGQESLSTKDGKLEGGGGLDKRDKGREDLKKASEKNTVVDTASVITMSAALAAAKIQSLWKGFKLRKELKTSEDTQEEHHIIRHKTVCEQTIQNSANSLLTQESQKQNKTSCDDFLEQERCCVITDRTSNNDEASGSEGSKMSKTNTVIELPCEKKHVALLHRTELSIGATEKIQDAKPRNEAEKTQGQEKFDLEQAFNLTDRKHSRFDENLDLNDEIVHNAHNKYNHSDQLERSPETRPEIASARVGIDSNMNLCLDPQDARGKNYSGDNFNFRNSHGECQTEVEGEGLDGAREENISYSNSTVDAEMVRNTRLDVGDELESANSGSHEEDSRENQISKQSVSIDAKPVSHHLDLLSNKNSHKEAKSQPPTAEQTISSRPEDNNVDVFKESTEATDEFELSERAEDKDVRTEPSLGGFGIREDIQKYKNGKIEETEEKIVCGEVESVATLEESLNKEELDKTTDGSNQTSNEDLEIQSVNPQLCRAMDTDSRHLDVAFPDLSNAESYQNCPLSISLHLENQPKHLDLSNNSPIRPSASEQTELERVPTAIPPNSSNLIFVPTNNEQAIHLEEFMPNFQLKSLPHNTTASTSFHEGLPSSPNTDKIVLSVNELLHTQPQDRRLIRQEEQTSLESVAGGGSGEHRVTVNDECEPFEAREASQQCDSSTQANTLVHTQVAEGDVLPLAVELNRQPGQVFVIIVSGRQ